MKMNIEVEARDVQVLAAHAARLGVPIERVAAETFADAIRRDLQSPGQSSTQNGTQAPSDHSDGAPSGTQSDEIGTDGSQTDGRDFMARLDASAATISAGTLRPITSDDISQAIAAARPQMTAPPTQRAAL